MVTAVGAVLDAAGDDVDCGLAVAPGEAVGEGVRAVADGLGLGVVWLVVFRLAKKLKASMTTTMAAAIMMSDERFMVLPDLTNL